MIAYITKMETIPENCIECTCFWCRLPLKSTRWGTTDIIKMPYREKRHKDCPLKIESEVKK